MKTYLVLLILFFNSFTLLAQKSLFNGNNLDGWTVHGTELWYVENGFFKMKLMDGRT